MRKLFDRKIYFCGDGQEYLSEKMSKLKLKTGQKTYSSQHDFHFFTKKKTYGPPDLDQASHFVIFCEVKVQQWNSFGVKCVCNFFLRGFQEGCKLLAHRSAVRVSQKVEC